MADPRQEQELQLGNYRLVKLLGKGGFALVFLGEHIFLERKAAIKVLRDSRMLTSSDLDSFLIEARTIGSLDHPHIVRVMDFGVDGKSNMPFLVMDFAPNGPLSRRHTKGNILPLPMIVEYV